MESQVKVLHTANAVMEESASICHWKISGQAKRVMRPESEYRLRNVPDTSGDAPCKRCIPAAFYFFS